MAISRSSEKYALIKFTCALFLNVLTCFLFYWCLASRSVPDSPTPKGIKVKRILPSYLDDSEIWTKEATDPPMENKADDQNLMHKKSHALIKFTCALLGYSILAKASFSYQNYRPGFDVSIPLFSKNHSTRGKTLMEPEDGPEYQLVDDVVIETIDTTRLDSSDRKNLLVFKGKRYTHGIGSETRNTLHHLHNDRDILIYTTCKHGKKWKDLKDERCAKDNLEYEKFNYSILMANSTFCLVPRGRRLGSFRFLEALANGCIPVLLSNNWVKPFEDVIDWSEIVVEGDERSLLQLPEIILRSYEWKKIHVERIVYTTIDILNERIQTHLSFTTFLWNLVNPSFTSFTGAIWFDAEYSFDLKDYPGYGKLSNSYSPSRKSINAKLFPYKDINTYAVLSLQPDTTITVEELDFAYLVWLSFPHRIIGFTARDHYYDEENIENFLSLLALMSLKDGKTLGKIKFYRLKGRQPVPFSDEIHDKVHNKDKVALTKEDSVIQEDRENNDDVGETRSESNEDESVKNGENSNVQQIRRGLTRSRSNYPESSASSTVDQDDEHGQDSEATISTSPSHHGDASEDKQSKVKNGNVSEDHKPPTSSPSPSPSLHSASTSPLPSPCQSPPSLSEKIRDRRRSSLAPRDSELITVTKRSRSGSRSPRRGSTTFLMGDDSIMVQLETGKRRLSSFCASSNDETMITIDDSLTEEEIVETLKAHKQIISNIKTQNWPMHRKLKILRRAKMYIKKHEGDLKQSKQAKDIVTKYRTYLEKSINRLKREIDNLVVQLTPWEMRIKKIESQFGSVVASYFTFLRWIFWINTFTSISMIVFLMVPEILRSNKDPTQMRKFEDANKNLTFKEMINTAWNFDGYLKYSPIFYGYYDNEETTSIGYRLPLVYFGVCLLLYAFSFFCILHKMTQNARNNRIGSKDDEYVFTWKLFTGWDFMIGNSETAYNKVASIVMGFKEVILEEKEKKKEEKNWKMIVRRVIANILVLLLLISSAYAVVFVVQRSLKLPENPGFIRENEVTIVISGIQTVYPNIFNIIAALEDYHPRIALRWQLARILVLNLLNLYAFLLATFDKIDEM
uniref:Exostosin GT47 domain-containing protein n=1 Tax=Tetranychus urticae TaxID=32264 RepID=T1JR72_TETUR